MSSALIVGLTALPAAAQDVDVVRLAAADVEIPALDSAFINETETHLDRLEKLGMAGVFVLWRDGEWIIERGCGLADRERSMAWSPEVVSTIGSITKQFTGAAILKLTEQGKLTPNDLITKYFDEVPEDKRGITLHHLLTHSSGIQDIPNAGDHTPIDRDQFIERAMAEPLAFEPGSRYEYSNAGYSLLGAIMELVTDEPYEQWLRENLFLPLGMNDTGYLLPEFSPDRVAKGYQGGERWGTVLERPMADDGPYWVLRGNGGIHSTARDMVRWGEALIDGEVLSEESMAQYWAPHIDESNGNEESFYGYGWVYMTLPNGQTLITHNGGNGILGADMMIVPEKRLIMFVQSNVISSDRAAMRLLQQVGGRLAMGMPYPELPDVKPLRAEQLRAVLGAYKSDEGLRVEITEAPNGIGVAAQDQLTYTQMFPNQRISAEQSSEMTEKIHGAMEAWYERHDIAPMHTLYQRDDAIEEFAARRDQRDAERTQMLGPFQRFEVLGTGDSGIDEYIAGTGVRIHFENGAIDQLFVWLSPDHVRGYLQSRGAWPPEYVHLGDGAFAVNSEGRSGPTPIALHFKEGAFGQPELVLETGQILSKVAVSD